MNVSLRFTEEELIAAGVDLIANAPLSFDGLTKQLTLPPATGTVPGYLSSDAQTVGGVKTFVALPKSAAAPTDSAELITKGYADALFSSGVRWLPAVLALADVTAIAAPADGDRYIATVTGGAIVAGQIYEWSAGSAAWVVTVPEEGNALYVLGGSAFADQSIIYSQASTWVSLGTSIAHQSLIGAGAASHADIDTILTRYQLQAFKEIVLLPSPPDTSMLYMVANYVQDLYTLGGETTNEGTVYAPCAPLAFGKVYQYIAPNWVDRGFLKSPHGQAAGLGISAARLGANTVNALSVYSDTVRSKAAYTGAMTVSSDAGSSPLLSIVRDVGPGTDKGLQVTVDASGNSTIAAVGSVTVNHSAVSNFTSNVFTRALYTTNITAAALGGPTLLKLCSSIVTNYGMYTQLSVGTDGRLTIAATGTPQPPGMLVHGGLFSSNQTVIGASTAPAGQNAGLVVIGAATQQAWHYNDTNYASMTVDSAGKALLNCTGDELSFASTDKVKVLNTTVATNDVDGAFVVAGGISTGAGVCACRAAGVQLTIVKTGVSQAFVQIVGASNDLSIQNGALATDRVAFANSLDASSSTVAGVMMAGGLGVAKSVFAGGNILSTASFGLIENNAYVSLSGTDVAYTSGSGLVINASTHLQSLITWTSGSISAASLTQGQLRWIVVTATNTVALLSLLPAVTDAFQAILVIGRVWYDGGLVVSDLHIKLAYDPYMNFTEAWATPSANSKRAPVVISANAGNVRDLDMSAGQLTRWPIVANHVQPTHMFTTSAQVPLAYMWRHIYAQANYLQMTPGNANVRLDTRLAMDYIDNGTTTTLLMTDTYWTNHRIYVYGGSNERVWVFGQAQYTTLNAALLARDGKEVVILADWLKDGFQAALVATITIQKGGDWSQATIRVE
jgi:hypothetical protein